MSGRVYSYVRNERQPRSWGGGGGSSAGFQGSNWQSQTKQYGSGSSYNNSSSYGGGRRDPISRSEGLGRSQVSRAPRAPPPAGDIRTSRLHARPAPRGHLNRSAPRSTSYMQPERESRYSGNTFQAPPRRMPRITPRRVPQRSSPQPRRPIRQERPRKRFLSDHTFSRSKRRRVSSNSRTSKISKTRKARTLTRLTPASLILASGVPGEAEEHKFLSVKFQGHPFIRPRALVSEESGMITFEIVEVTKKSRRRMSQRCEFSVLKRDVLSLIAFEGDKIPEVLVRKRKEKDIDLAMSDDGRRKVKVEQNAEEDEEELEEVMDENMDPEDMTSDQLRRELQKRGLESRGLKAELIRRLREYKESSGEMPNSGDIVLQTVNSSALFVHVDSEEEDPEEEADQREDRSNYGDEDEEPVYDEDQHEDEQEEDRRREEEDRRREEEDRRREEDSRSDKEDLYGADEHDQNEGGQQDQRDNEHSEEDYIDEPEKGYSDDGRNQYNTEERDGEESEEEEDVEGGRGDGEERMEEDGHTGSDNLDKEPMDTDEVDEEDSPWDDDNEPDIRPRSPSKNEEDPIEANPKKDTKTDGPNEEQSLGVDEHQFQARESSDNGEQAQNNEQDMGDAPEEGGEEIEGHDGVYKEDVGLKNGKSMVEALMEMNKNADVQKEAAKTGDREPNEKDAEKKSTEEAENAEAPPAEPESFETTSYRVVIVIKRGARIIRRADSLLSREKLDRSRIIILEFALTPQNSTPKKAFTTLMDGPYEDTANAEIWPEKGQLSFKHTLTNILSDMLEARSKEKRVSNAEAIFEENQELKKKNRGYESKLEDLTSEMERLKNKIQRAKDTLG